MNDYKELIENLREEADAVQAIEWDIPICASNHIAQAADTIERLIAENARLKAERDAAVADLKDLIMGFNSCICDCCKHMRDNECELLGCQWEWRGVTDIGVGGKKEKSE